ncbi:epidermal retinol dehydrogenase 2-like [Tubulanus polymorphus]|uniref:epidermal retinol dehydrogenase 2-like n=1 Tax=Tubulanus polymorphus TaxID=672921 RepID=UPI003DA2D7B8
MKQLYELIRALLDATIAQFWSVVHFFVSPAPKCVRGKVVLITGAASPNGIGHWLAVKFAELGSVLVLWDIDKLGLQATAEEIQTRNPDTKVFTFVCDVGERESVYETANLVHSRVGDVDILVNNAGIVNGRNFLDIPDENLMKIFQVNLFAHFWTVKAFLPSMMRRDSGHVVNIASCAGLIGMNRLADYCSTKFAAVGFTESLRQEIQRDDKNIQTTLVCPYLIDTGMFTGCEAKFPALFPKLNPKLTADRIMQAILTNQHIVCIPRLIYIMSALKTILPVDVVSILSNFAGTSTFMDNFIGRQKAG